MKGKIGLFSVKYCKLMCEAIGIFTLSFLYPPSPPKQCWKKFTGLHNLFQFRDKSTLYWGGGGNRPISGEIGRGQLNPQMKNVWLR